MYNDNDPFVLFIFPLCLQAIIIQKHMRGFLARRRYAKNVKRVIICQGAIRRFLAKRKLRALKKEARSVEHHKKLYRGLENKIISMQQKIEELVRIYHSFIMFLGSYSY